MGKKAAALLRVTVFILIIWMLQRFVLRWFLPFVAAFCLARLLEPVVRMLCKRLRLSRVAASALGTLLVFASAIAFVSLVVVHAAYELSVFAGRLAELSGRFPETVTSLFLRMRGLIEAAPAELQSPIRAALEGLPDKATELAATLSKWIISRLTAILSAGPKIILFVFTCALGTFFISSTYSQTSAFIMRQIPERCHQPMSEIRSDLRRTSGKWLKAQLILSGVTFCELFVLFCTLRVDFAVSLAITAAVADILPAVGTGIVLIPWAVFSFATGNTKNAVLLFAGFVVIIIVRNILESKLLSKGLGLPPIVALIAMYVGYMALGVLGMAVLPIALIMLRHLHDRGYIRLWK